MGDPEAPAAVNLRGPGAASGGSPRHNLPTTDKPRPAPWKKEPACRFPLGCSSASTGSSAPAAPLGSASPASPPSACSARRPPRSAQLGCWEYNGEQERPRPLFPLILQPSGWSPQYIDLPGPWTHADHALASSPFAPGLGQGAAIATA